MQSPWRYIPELIERQVSGPEKGRLERSDLEFHKREYDRLRADQDQAFRDSRLPESPSSATSLNDLLVRVRLQ